MQCARWLSTSFLVLAVAACGESRAEVGQEALGSSARWGYGANAPRGIDNLPDESVLGPVDLVPYDAGAPVVGHASINLDVSNRLPSSIADAGAPQPPVPPAVPPVDEPDAQVVDAVPAPEQDDGLLDLNVCDLLESLLCDEGLECVDGVCTQRRACTAGRNCDAACTSAACSLDCGDAESCKADCGPSTQCDVSCVGTESCEPICRAGSCEIDCQAAEKCDHVKCKDGAQCVLQCGAGAGPCRFEECKEPRQCAGNVLVCNRPCPLF
jgi:hypothetical protein